MSKKRVCLVGASGRMGQRVMRLLSNHATLQLSVILTHAGAHEMSVPEGVTLAKTPAAAVAVADVVIDFAAPAVCAQLAPACRLARVPYVVASTGLGENDQNAIEAAADSIAVLQAANLSLGVNVMLELVRAAASQLQGFDIEISEIHHRFKRDAPSGTAYALGEAAMLGAGKKTPVVGRCGMADAARAPSDIGYAAIRGGEVPGEHTVYFFGDAERLEITHRSASADIFGAGALTAAMWLLRQTPGRYTMRDVLRPAPQEV